MAGIDLKLPIQVNLPDDWIEQIVNRLRNDPEAEWVEIIRCKDCKHWREETDHTCRKWGGASPRNANGYCDEGEGATMRLIDADALIEHLRKDPLFPLVERYGITGVIEAAPTIDHVKHGEWYITEDMPYFGHIQEYLTCSACEGRFHGTGVKEWDYCPNCGAKMDGGIAKPEPYKEEADDTER